MVCGRIESRIATFFYHPNTLAHIADRMELAWLIFFALLPKYSFFLSFFSGLEAEESQEREE